MTEASAAANENLALPVRELIAALKAAAERSPSPFILCITPSHEGTEPQSPRALFFRRTEEFIKERIA